MKYNFRCINLHTNVKIADYDVVFHNEGQMSNWVLGFCQTLGFDLYLIGAETIDGLGYRTRLWRDGEDYLLEVIPK